MKPFADMNGLKLHCIAMHLKTDIGFTIRKLKTLIKSIYKVSLCLADDNNMNSTYFICKLCVIYYTKAHCEL